MVKKKYRRKPEAEARRVAALRRALRSTAVRERMSSAAKVRYSDPREREKTAVALRKAFATNPRMRKRNREVLKKARKLIPRLAGGLCGSPEYKIWDAMIQRCANSRAMTWKNYGGRGIKVHPRWLGRGGFLRFYGHVGPRPSPKHSLGRKDNDGNYEPGNVRWETWLEQMRNSRRNHWVTIGGVTLHLAEWARRIGICPPALAYRLRCGWTEEALLRPGQRGVRAPRVES